MKPIRRIFCKNGSIEKRQQKCIKIALFGHFGSTNFGNESTLQAVIHHLRCYQPDAAIYCISTNAEATATTHQIEAIPISRNIFCKAWLPQNSFLRFVRRMLIGIPSEPLRWIDGVMRLSRTDALIIPGTGLLSDAYGLAGWGPYSVFKWALTAKICRCRLLFVSVGAGPIYSTLGRWFVKSALSLADYRSYRDNSTLQYLKSIGFRADNDPVYPDLVFSLPVPALRHEQAKRCQRSVIGLGLMEYAGRYSIPAPTNNIFPAYLKNLVQVVRSLLAQKTDVRLLIGDRNDLRTKKEFRDLLKDQLSPSNRHFVDEPISSVDDLLSQIARTDIVIATRFHNVLLALLCEKPVISISFHHKCESLMSAMGLSAYCMDINHFTSERLIEKICQLKANADKLTVQIEEKVMEARRALDQQYKFIFHDMWVER